MTRPKHPPSFTVDCVRCQQTYFSKSPGPHICDVCGGPLLVRREGAEPFEAESYCQAAEDAATLPTLFDYLTAAGEPMFSGGEQAE